MVNSTVQIYKYLSFFALSVIERNMLKIPVMIVDSYVSPLI